MHHSNKKFSLLIFSLKRNFLQFLFLLFTILLVIFSKNTFESAKSSLLLWANSIVPALLPFFIATELLSHTNIVSFLGTLLNKIMRPIFNVPGEGSFAFIMGIISGYPVGAKIVTKLRTDNICSKEEAERLLAFTNNSGPLFILSTVGISMFADTKIGILLLVTHILACISVGIIFRFWKSNSNINKNMGKNFEKTKLDIVSFSNLGNVLSNSITNAISTIIMIGGFVVLFSVIISILEQCGILHIFSKLIEPILNFFKINNSFSNSIITGIFEVTTGIKEVSNISSRAISINIIVCSFLLGFGGISILLQVFSIISKTDISIFPYFLGKSIQAILASFYTYLAIHNIPFLNMDLSIVSLNLNDKLDSINNYLYMFKFIVLIILIYVLYVFCKKLYKYYLKQKKIRE